MTIYKAFEAAKNGTKIPVFLSGRTMESRYNPERDAENLFNNIDSESDFFLVLGIGSGIFLELLSQKKTGAKILAFELSEEDINFLRQNERIEKLYKNSKIIFCNSYNLEEKLIQNYLPAKYGNLKIIEQRGWINENQEKINNINSIIKKTLGIISADYSVQAHFGKIWNCNILNNCLFLQNHCLSAYKYKAELLEKTAVIVAAGPSLDKTINLFSESDRDKYFIFSTDTAARALIKRKIIPEVVVSIDGQAVSYNHFMESLDTSEQAPLFTFDLSANPSAVRHISETGNKLSFFCSGHPLSTAINASNSFALSDVFSGAGTVTISALDLALQSGFRKLLILGADFSYSNGKAYSSGTYLDTLYNQQSTKLSKSEQIFSKLMFRTELKSLSPEIKTTNILEAYKFSLEKYLNDKNIHFIKKNDVYKLECTLTKEKEHEDNSHNQGIFKTASSSFSLDNFRKKIASLTQEEIEPLLLPYVAWLRNNTKYKSLPYNDLLKLALESIVSYNR